MRTSGWQSGINSCVRLAAMMPAMRAAPSTSPFLASPLRTMSRVFRLHQHAAFCDGYAFGRRLAEHPPCGLRRRRQMREFFATRHGHSPGRRERGVAREQRTRRRGDVVLAHQAFADQERRNAGFGEPREIVRREDAALADDDMAGGNARASRSQVASVVSKVFKLRLLMPISRDFRRSARSSSFFVVHFDQHVHAERECRRLEFAAQASSTAAMMMRMQSAPQARASVT